MLFMGILQHLEGGNVSVYRAWVKLIKSIVSVAQQNVFLTFSTFGYHGDRPIINDALVHF